MKEEKEILKSLYSQSSKHSNYQVLSNKLSNVLSNKEITVSSRYEKERLYFIADMMELKNKTILDIGGNTGFFSLELIDLGIKKVCYYEGNNTHAEFVKKAVKLLEVEDLVEIYNEYFLFEEKPIDKKFDITLLLNVLHHIGDDYDDKSLSIEKAKENIISSLNNLSKKTNKIVFQLGFNWKGDKNLGLFENGTKEEMISFIENGIKNFWKIKSIGIAEQVNNNIIYKEINENNIKRNDNLGEFLNRPIFILESF